MANAYTRVLVCVGALTVGLAQIAQGQAQEPPSQQEPAQQQEPSAAAAQDTHETVTSADVNDQEVEQFAKSFEEIVEIQQETDKQLEGVQDSAEVTRVKQEANQKMAEAVQAQGMKIERFNLIARSMNQDATLKQRVQQKIQELRRSA